MTSDFDSEGITAVGDVPHHGSNKLAWAAMILTLLIGPSLLISPWLLIGVLVAAGVVNLVASRKTRSSPERYGGLRVARWARGLWALTVVLLVVLPSFLRARRTEPAGPVGDMRSLIAAMQTYASANGGFHDGRLACLSRPSSGCIPGYPAEGPKFAGEDITSEETRRGYRFTFHPGKAADAERIASGKISPTSIVHWAYTAEPVHEKRWRQFCAEESGMVCVLPGDTDMTVVNGRCPANCPPLR